jgi:hypothetical protein
MSAEQEVNMLDDSLIGYGVPVLLIGAVVVIALATLVLHLLFPPAKGKRRRRNVLFHRPRYCPLCHYVLAEVERYGVGIQVCPSCQGVWLSQGKLEQIMR